MKSEIEKVETLYRVGRREFPTLKEAKAFLASDHGRRALLLLALDCAPINWEGYTGAMEEVLDGLLEVFEIKIKAPK